MKTHRVLLTVIATAVWCVRALSFDVVLAVSPQGDSNEITVTIVDPTPPGADNWVGYAVVRHVHGICEDPVFLTDVVAFDTPVSVTDSSLPTDLAYSYVAALVDADGVPGWFAGWDAIETLGGLDHPIARGRVQSGGVFGGGALVACPDMCWELPYLTGFGIGVSGAPENVSGAIDTDQVFDIYGSVDYGWEGPWFTAITEGVPTECGAVSARQETWSTVKGRFW
jgi:hypothetical protein